MFQHAASTEHADPASTYTRVLQSHHGQATHSASRHQAVLSSQQRSVDPHAGRARQETVEEGTSATGTCESKRSKCTIINYLLMLITIQYNTIQYNTIQYNTIQYNTIQYNTIQYNTIQYNTITFNSPPKRIFLW